MTLSIKVSDGDFCSVTETTFWTNRSQYLKAISFVQDELGRHDVFCCKVHAGQNDICTLAVSRDRPFQIKFQVVVLLHPTFTIHPSHAQTHSTTCLMKHVPHRRKLHSPSNL